MANRRTGESGQNTEVWYAPDGGEYPVDADNLSAVERTQLVAQGYSTTKPSDPAPVVEVPQGGPLGGSPNPDA
jgi:hypothetical protein